MSRFEEVQKSLKKSIGDASTVVIKLGTGILTPHIESNDMAYFESLARQVKQVRDLGKRVILVSSGAVGFGRKIVREPKSKTEQGKGFNRIERESLTEKQALASLGQSLLIETYRKTFALHGLEVAQILVSILDFQSRSHFQNLRNTLDQLMSWGAIPVINENDAVAIEGLKFGDNDTLSALIAGMYPQSMLSILTTVEGYFHEGVKVDLLEVIEAQHLKSAGKPSDGGIGGMKTKLMAARKILISGQFMNIASGDDPAILQKVMGGERAGTWFYDPEGSAINSKKRWLLHNRHILGRLQIDDGAVRALKKSSASLLAVGVVKAEGKFLSGDVVEILDESGARIARGMAAIDSGRLKALKKEGAEERGLEAVHRDNLILTEE